MANIIRRKVRVSVISCTHGNLIHEERSQQFLDEVEDFDPHIRIHLGDAVDLCCLRRGAGADEKTEDMLEDIGMAKRFLRAYRPQVFCHGNHDKRLYELSRKSASGAMRALGEAAVKDFENVLDEVGAVHRTDGYSAKDVLEVEGWRVLHGTSHGKYSAAKMGDVYGSCFYGHTHSPVYWPAETYDQNTVVNAGCMIDISKATYAHGYTRSLAWRNSFVLAELVPDRPVLSNIQLRILGGWNDPDD